MMQRIGFVQKKEEFSLFFPFLLLLLSSSQSISVGPARPLARQLIPARQAASQPDRQRLSVPRARGRREEEEEEIDVAVAAPT
jgi:hypothetical protein